ncbi:hypothetical protein ACFSQ3_01045 [Sphingobacterium corticis]|uniref:Uncharacterized protein n=1 Tax=Sphingobacterium corticis TaxID=1812823 RepID=A0ABW5NF54_9SPHI
MYKLKAKVLISKDPKCNCGGFYHPGEEFNEKSEKKAQQYIDNNEVDVIEAPAKKASAKEDKTEVKTKEAK